jgi:RNA polymerase sigma-70 factor (ECF subfamily)
MQRKSVNAQRIAAPGSFEALNCMLPAAAETEIEDESSLVRSAADGDADAFTELFHRHYDVIYSYAYRLSLRQADAEDIAQDTFIKAARNLAAYRPDAAFRNWLFRICTNTARDWARKQQRRTALTETLDHASPVNETDEDQRPLEEALGSLPAELRSAIALVFYEGMSHAEAASVLGCAETTVSWRVFRAKQKLKRYLQRHE